MRSSKGNTLVILLVVVLIIQVYILFFSRVDPVIISKQGRDETESLKKSPFYRGQLIPGSAQLGGVPGKMEGVPGGQNAPVRDDPVERDGSSQSPGGEGSKPGGGNNQVQGASQGEGNEEPATPKTTATRPPTAPAVTRDWTELKLDLAGSENVYKTLIYSVLILEDDGKIAVLPAQAIKIKRIIDDGNRINTVVPNAQMTIMNTLTEKQLKYIYYRKYMKTGNVTPLGVSSMRDNVLKLEKMLKPRFNSNDSSNRE